MAPVKFDDLQKVATEELNDDYQTSGYVLKAKQKTSLSGVVLSHQVDFFDKSHPTPAKITWKIPKVAGGRVSIDKLEMDKGGNFKFEASSDKLYPKLKVDCKSDLKSINKVSLGCSYIGVPDAQMKFECKAMKPTEFNGEAMYAKGIATCGVKFNNAILKGGLPDVGLRVRSGPLFCAVVAKDQFGAINAAGAYKACPDVNCAASGSYVMKTKDTNFTVGMSYRGLLKAKVSQDQSVCLSAKHSFAKGFTMIGGLKYSVKNRSLTSWGLQLSVE